MKKLLAVSVWMLSSPALAQPAQAPDGATGDAPPPTDTLEGGLQNFSHKHQFGLRATFGKGYRIAFAYGDHEICGQKDDGPDETPCYSAAPAFTDLDLSFGLTDGIEVSASLRLGLQDEYDTAFPLSLGLGVRAYADPPSRVKVFVGARLLWDLTETGAESKQDFAVRAEPGLQVELVRYVALYVQTGVTIGFLRWLRFEVDAGGGVQFRFP